MAFRDKPKKEYNNDRNSDRPPTVINVAVGLSQVSKYGKSNYVAVSFKEPNVGKDAEPVWKTFANENEYGAFRGLTMEEFKVMVESLNDYLSYLEGKEQGLTVSQQLKANVKPLVPPVVEEEDESDIPF